MVAAAMVVETATTASVQNCWRQVVPKGRLAFCHRVEAVR
jgi:hypothetical protein